MDLSSWKNIYRHKNNKKAICFIALFTIYIFCGLCISYPTTFNTNIFFGADNNRAFLDLTDITYNHYRVKVHPLFLLLAETITLGIDGIVNFPRMSVIIIEAFCGTVSVYVFYSILEGLNLKKRICLIFSVIYAFSFSVMIFSSVPETFIFAGCSLIIFWHFILLASCQRGRFTKEESRLLVFFGIVSFGITLTNYCSYLIGLVYLLAVRYDKERINRFIGINGINGAIIIILCKFQNFIWSDSPLFWESIISGLHGQGYEEFKYMNWNISFSKSINWIKQTLMYPLISSEVYIAEYPDNYHPLKFSGYDKYIKILFVLFLLVFISGILAFLKQMVEKSGKREGYILGILSAFLGNMMLHYIYGNKEAFIYSQHFLFLFLIAMAACIEYIPIKRCMKLIEIILWCFAVGEIYNNFVRFFESTCMVLKYESESFLWIKSLKGAVLCGGLILIAYIVQIHRKWKDNIFGFDDTSEREQIICYYKLSIGYSIFICIIGVFIAYNY